MFWKHASLRKVLLGTMIILGGWGLFLSLLEVSQTWEEYQESQNLTEWAHASSEIMKIAQHLAYERGRTAVVLQNQNPISEADRQFIEKRRTLADQAVSELHARIAAIPDIGHEPFHEGWENILALRKQVDLNTNLPLTQRDATLVSRWMAHTTTSLNDAVSMGWALTRHYHQEEKASRLTILSFLMYRLRLTAGAEATMIAQRLSGNTRMEPGEIHALFELRGQQQAIWVELGRLVEFSAIPHFRKTFDELRQRQAELRLLQDSVLKSWIEQRPVEIRIGDLTAASPPLLDGISEFISATTEETIRVAQARMSEVRQTLWIHLFFVVSELLVLLLAIIYVMTKVVRPLEYVDKKLRLIEFNKEDSGERHENEIERLSQTAISLKTLFGEKKRLESELRELAFYDALTQLANRRLLLDRLRQEFLRARRNNSSLALLYIDLDEFKPINDLHGHDVGDWLLRAAADRIVSCIRSSDTAARMGGDEFVVLLADVVMPEDARAIGEKIRAALIQPFVTPDGRRLEISASIGVAIARGDASNENDLISLADEAMYAAKSAGRNRVEMLPAREDQG